LHPHGAAAAGSSAKAADASAAAHNMTMSFFIVSSFPVFSPAAFFQGVGDAPYYTKNPRRWAATAFAFFAVLW
jgi:hypothetical protein